MPSNTSASAWFALKKTSVNWCRPAPSANSARGLEGAFMKLCLSPAFNNELEVGA
jgi:hypothetical protein